MHARALIMGMPVSVSIEDAHASTDDTEAVFALLRAIDERFSTYKAESEIRRINRGEIALIDASEEMQEILRRAEETKRLTNGLFNIKRPDGLIDPSGIVKGWAIERAAAVLRARGLQHFLIDVGGDVAAEGGHVDGTPWRIGIREPGGALDSVVAVTALTTAGVATSGAYVRGDHIYDPREPSRIPRGLASMTVVGPDVYEADRFATAAYVLGEEGITLIESLHGLEAYAISEDGRVLMTTGMDTYLSHV